MRYPIIYQKAGNFNVSELLEKMNNHRSLFDSTFGVGKWTFTGSAAVIIYALEYKPDLISYLDEPNDLDFLVESKMHINLNYIGDYNERKQESLSRSYTFVNSSTGNSIDVSILPNLKKNIIRGFPLYDAKLLLDEYKDSSDIGERKDAKKIIALEQIIDKIPVSENIEEKDYSHLEPIRGRLFF